MSELPNPAPEPGWTPPEVTDHDFRLFQRLIHEASGIYLSPAKRALLHGRLSKRIRTLGLGSLNAYYQRVAEDDSELQIMLDSIATNETSFFREPAQFEFLDREIIPEWLATRRAREVRVWSAGCSTGEEPFSLAMLLHRRLVARGWTVRITATDLSSRALDRAARGEWSIERAAQIPDHYLRRFLLKGKRSNEGLMRAGPEIRAMVDFRPLNLKQSDYPFERPFDLIFCRNVMIYFDLETKRHVVGAMLRHLVPGGYLFLGHSESAAGFAPALVQVRPAIGRHTPEVRC